MDSHGTRLAGFGDTTGCGSGARRGLGSQPGPTPAAQQGGTGTTRARVAGRGAGACGRRGDGGSWVGAGMPDRADRTVGFDGNVAPFRRSVEVPLPPPPRLFPDE